MNRPKAKANRLYASIVTCITVGISVYAYHWISQNWPRPENSEESPSSPESQNTAGIKSSKVCYVVDENIRDNCREFLDANPSAILVGVKGVELESCVDPSDSYRVIETESDEGWVHIVKHLRAAETHIPLSASGYVNSLKTFIGNIEVYE